MSKSSVQRNFVMTLFVGGLLLGVTDVSFAQTTAFNAGVIGHITRPSGGCASGASLCGSTVIEGFGPANYDIVFFSFVPTTDACGNYGASTTFTLGDGSSLSLGEVGVACGPGISFLHGPLFTAYGNPRTWSGSWEIQSATGQFAGLTGGGTDAGHTAGAAVRATYRGTLTKQ